LILASASPRRRQLLAEAGYSFDVDPADVEEPDASNSLSPEEHVALAALRKALVVAARHKSGLVLAADTVCAARGVILGKPADRADAERMIRLQEDRDSDVITGLCVYRAGSTEWVGTIDTSVVRFRQLTHEERAEHLDSGRWRGKAGAYGIQDNDPFVSIVRGSWSNVVGLPMEKLEELLERYPGLTQ
jgi:septum formation protein